MSRATGADDAELAILVPGGGGQLGRDLVAAGRALGERVEVIAPGSDELDVTEPGAVVEAVADHICETLFLQDRRVRRVKVKIVKLAISEGGEAIGITLVRHRP